MILAYLDPGAGSMIFQALLAAGLAIPLFFRAKLNAVVQRLTGRTQSEPSDGNAADDTPRG